MACDMELHENGLIPEGITGTKPAGHGKEFFCSCEVVICRDRVSLYSPG